MNIFRLIGDLCHLASFFFLLHRLRERKSAVGISLKTQELYLLVFLARYLDLFTNFHSLYNTVMKVVYLLAAATVVYLLRAVEPFKSSYKAEARHDTFMHLQFAVLPCAVLAFIFNYGNLGHWHGIAHYLFEVSWAFSIYLEAVAIAPQLILLQRHKSVENITSYYVASLGVYRALYIVNWVYRFYHEPHFMPWIELVSGVVQTVFYLDFFYYFLLSKSAGLSTVVLPM